MHVESPALTHQSKLYPPAWRGRVPKRIRMLKTVRPDFPFLLEPGKRRMVAELGREYEAWVNRHGAVAVCFGGGQQLGVKPGEFEVIEWTLALAAHDGVVQ